MDNRDDVFISKAFEEKVDVDSAMIRCNADRFYAYQEEHEYIGYEHGEDEDHEYTFYGAAESKEGASWNEYIPEFQVMNQ